MAEGRRAVGRPISARRRREEAVETATVDTGEGPSGPSERGTERPKVAPRAKGKGATKSEVAEASSRFAQLREAVAGLRTRSGETDMERWMLVAGAVLVPLGLVAIVLGWQGAANTPYEFEQLPYVISGGLLGVGFVALGGFLYFGYWLTRMVREQRAQSDRVAEALGRIEELLGGGAKSNGAVRPVASRASRRATSFKDRPSRDGFVATAGGTMFHRPDCVVVEGKTGLRSVTGRERDMGPCGICDPLAA